ncbi:MAG: hypothetical protein ACRD29_05795 [Acidimicrobiales bacterium]
MRIMGVADADSGAQPGSMLEGVARFKLAPNATTLNFDVVQGKKEVEVTASSSEEANEKVTREGHVVSRSRSSRSAAASATSTVGAAPRARRSSTR